LLDAIKLSDRAYLFDNSGTEHKLVAEIADGRDIQFDPAFIPNWFDRYVLQKLNSHS
jgi:predicted ABC-type ATPase